MFAGMTQRMIHTASPYPDQVVVWDLRDCFTESFPEFIPFCNKLYYFSNYKDFSTLLPA